MSTDALLLLAWVFVVVVGALLSYAAWVMLSAAWTRLTRGTSPKESDL